MGALPDIGGGGGVLDFNSAKLRGYSDPVIKFNTHMYMYEYQSWALDNSVATM